MGRPSEQRGGSISVWESEQDMPRFVQWPVHARIMGNCRGKVGVATDSWQTEEFAAHEALSRAANTIDRAHTRS